MDKPPYAGVNRQQLPLMFRGTGDPEKWRGSSLQNNLADKITTLFSLLCKSGLPETVGDVIHGMADTSHNCHTE